MKKAIQGVVILILLGIGAYFFFPHGDPTLTVSPAPVSTGPILHLPSKDISLIIADTDATRELGLGGRASIPEDQAILFVFDKPDTYEFWMKDMQFPIDIIWLDAEKSIVFIESDVSPDSYPDSTFAPEKESLFVIEANAGFVSNHNLKVGDKLNIDLKK